MYQRFYDVTRVLCLVAHIIIIIQYLMHAYFKTIRFFFVFQTSYFLINVGFNYESNLKI